MANRRRNNWGKVVIISVLAFIITALVALQIELIRVRKEMPQPEIKESFDEVASCPGNCRDYTLGYRPFDIRCRALDPVFNYWLFPNIMDTGCGVRPEPSCGAPCATDCPEPDSDYGRPLPIPSDIPDPF